MKKYGFFLVFVLFYSNCFSLFAENIDESLSRQIRENFNSPFMDKTMKGFTELGSYEATSVILIGMYTFGNDKLRNTTKLSTFSVIGAVSVCSLLKWAVNRERPCGNTSRFNSSFPSGHATGAFAFSYIIAKQYPKLTIPLYLTAATIAFSRVYLGKHYVTDVLAGSALGTASGWIVMKNNDTLLRITF